MQQMEPQWESGPERSFDLVTTTLYGLGCCSHLLTPLTRGTNARRP